MNDLSGSVSCVCVVGGVYIIKNANWMTYRMENYFLTVLEARSSGSKLCRVVPFAAVREELFRASPLVSSGLLQIFGYPSLVAMSPQSLPSSSQGVLPVFVSGSKFPLFIRTSFVPA